MNILDTILSTKKQEVEMLHRSTSLDNLRVEVRKAGQVRSFTNALRSTSIALIAEIKKASPSAGDFSPSFDHRVLAREYELGGAQALSVVTDTTFFKGRVEHLADVRHMTGLPLLRKDFIIDEYQIYESRLLGADAVLLIVRLLKREKLEELVVLTKELGLAAIVEAHDEDDVAIANAMKAGIIGINNRDLRDFTVSLDRSLALRGKIWNGALAVSESGIRNREQVAALTRAGFDAVLVGEHLIRSGNRSKALSDLTVG